MRIYFRWEESIKVYVLCGDEEWKVDRRWQCHCISVLLIRKVHYHGVRWRMQTAATVSGLRAVMSDTDECCYSICSGNVYRFQRWMFVRESLTSLINSYCLQIGLVLAQTYYVILTHRLVMTWTLFILSGTLCMLNLRHILMKLSLFCDGWHRPLTPVIPYSWTYFKMNLCAQCCHIAFGQWCGFNTT